VSIMHGSYLKLALNNGIMRFYPPAKMAPATTRTAAMDFWIKIFFEIFSRPDFGKKTVISIPRMKTMSSISYSAV